ncbi:MAG: pimeloyl-ACP methyl ester esterase BioH [Thiohalophilus sp.]|uniref:pimeloyl-ACP methyl ester esterase BioH n=1 Tax=Thiohalophilus sp. TaxID=3028392 RepID=UPI002870327C|nr:pimeloyl-ACP methyl ester esterase BioH [Thiohalophilus sp.]MDR9435466.1 pimeloyl-ACP methyl ester esterase BioH [Thiohalophilus sp.]
MADTAPLQVTRTGQGPDLVLLHGWGMHSGIWHGVIESLESHYRLHLVDLPGHGQSQHADSEFDLTQLADRIWQSVSPHLSGPAFWLGWSLGGLAALQIAVQRPEQVRALMLVASTPRFSQTDDWPHAMPSQLLESFAEQLREDYRTTLQRFLALQVKGSESAREALRTLRQRVLETADVNVTALQSGLTILKEADLREQLSLIRRVPLLLVMGKQDMLVPLSAAAALTDTFDDSQTVIIEGAGHAPFVSHPQTFAQQVMMFLHAR